MLENYFLGGLEKQENIKIELALCPKKEILELAGYSDLAVN